jgi:hypothetical protein
MSGCQLKALGPIEACIIADHFISNVPDKVARNAAESQFMLSVLEAGFTGHHHWPVSITGGIESPNLKELERDDAPGNPTWTSSVVRDPLAEHRGWMRGVC